MYSIAETIHELAHAYSEIREAPINDVARYIAARWTPVEIEFAYLSAKRTNEHRRKGDFNVEPCPSHVLTLRFDAREGKLATLNTTQLATLVAGLDVENVVEINLSDPNKQFVYYDLNPKTGKWRVTYTKRTLT